MPTISVFPVGGVTAIGVSNVVLINRLQLIGDFEYQNGQWVGGDGKFPGVSAVLAVVALREGALTANSPAVAASYSKLADSLEKELAPRIESFLQTINEAKSAMPQVTAGK